MKLNLPEYQFRTRINDVGKKEIFDIFRKKFVSLTPEEWVRQNFLSFLMIEKQYPKSLIAVEKVIKVNKMIKRFDSVVYNRNGMPISLIEFKSPNVKLTQKVMEQVSRYNISLNVDYLIVSNGLLHYCCFIDRISQQFTFLKEIPEFTLISKTNSKC